MKDEAGTTPVPPAQFPDFAEDIKLLTAVEKYAAKEKLGELIEVALDVHEGLRTYTKLLLQKFRIEEVRAEATCKSALAFEEAYEAVHKVVRTKENADYDSFCERAAEAAQMAKAVVAPNAINEIADASEKLHVAYKRALTLKYQGLVPLLDRLSTAVSVICTIPEVKSIWRVLEKLVLRPDTGIPWDIVRAQVSCANMRELKTAFDLLMEDPAVQIVQVNDRFANPKGGWADCSVYFCFPNAEFADVIAEVQFCHVNMLLVRQNMGANQAYSEARFFAELVKNQTLEVLRTLPWSRIDAWKERAVMRAKTNADTAGRQRLTRASTWIV